MCESELDRLSVCRRVVEERRPHRQGNHKDEEQDDLCCDEPRLTLGAKDEAKRPQRHLLGRWSASVPLGLQQHTYEDVDGGETKSDSVDEERYRLAGYSQHHTAAKWGVSSPIPLERLSSETHCPTSNTPNTTQYPPTVVLVGVNTVKYSSLICFSEGLATVWASVAATMKTSRESGVAIC